MSVDEMFMLKMEQKKLISEVEYLREKKVESSELGKRQEQLSVLSHTLRLF